MPISSDLCKSSDIPDLAGDHPDIHKTRKSFTRPLSLSGMKEAVVRYCCALKL